jgi:hypothetical protein
MDTLRSIPTPYGSCSVAESISLPMTALPTTGSLSSAAGTIGNCNRLSVSRNWLRVEFKGSGIQPGYRIRGHHGGIGGNPVPHLARYSAARNQRHRIDWDRLCAAIAHRSCAGIGEERRCGPVPRRPRADIYGDCPRGSGLGRSHGRVGGGRGRGEGAP